MNFDCKATTASRLKKFVRCIITTMTLLVLFQCRYTFNAQFLSKRNRALKLATKFYLAHTFRCDTSKYKKRFGSEKEH